jgi:hypothetical protein
VVQHRSFLERPMIEAFLLELGVRVCVACDLHQYVLVALVETDVEMTGTRRQKRSEVRYSGMESKSPKPTHVGPEGNQRSLGVCCDSNNGVVWWFRTLASTLAVLRVFVNRAPLAGQWAGRQWSG